MIALIAYGIGNLRPVQKALEHVGAEVTLTSDPEVIVTAGPCGAPRRTNACSRPLTAAAEARR